MFGFKNRKDQDTKKETSTAIGLGIMFGSIIGALTDNIGIWLPPGDGDWRRNRCQQGTPEEVATR